MRKQDAIYVEHPRYGTLACYVEGHTGWMTGEFSHDVMIFTERNELVANKRVFGCEDADEAANYAVSLV